MMLQRNDIQLSDEYSFPLTSAQLDIYLEQEQHASLPVSTTLGAIPLPLDIDLDTWEQAVCVVVQQDPILRSKLLFHDAEIRQQPIHANTARPVFQRFCVSESQMIGDACKSVHDMTRPDGVRHWFVYTKQGALYSAISISHIFTDGHSMNSLFTRIGFMYAKLLNNEDPGKISSPSFYDFLRNTTASLLSDKALAYWKERLRKVRPVSFSIHKNQAPEFRCATRLFTLEETKIIHAACERLGCSLARFFQQIYILALDSIRIPERDDWLLYVMHSGRKPPYLETLGCFAKTGLYVVHEGLFEISQTIRRFLADPITQHKEALRHGKESVFPSMSQIHDFIDNSGIRVRYNFYNFIAMDSPMGRIEGEIYDTQPMHEIQLRVILREGRIQLQHLYHTQYFGDTVFLDRLHSLAMQLTDPLKSKLSDLSILLPDEQNAYSEMWNPSPHTVSVLRIEEAFIEQAQSLGTQPAIVDKAATWSYQKLEQTSRRIAYYLQRSGVSAGDRVGILLHRKPEIIAAILGVLRAGASYVPLDPKYPQERIGWSLEDSAAKLLLCEDVLQQESLDIACLTIESVLRHTTDDCMIEPHDASVHDVAYCIYTSGSTGMPKGVLITHRNAMNFLEWAVHTIGKAELSGMLASTSVCFDLSVFEIFAPLISGGTIYLVENALEFPNMPFAEHVYLLNTVPSIAGELLRTKNIPDTVRTIILAGEKLDQKLVNELYRKTKVIDIFDCYGPSETTTYSTWIRRTPDGETVVGKPIWNTRVYIVGSHGKLIPPGCIGEVWIGGAGVALGYWNRSELTKNFFLENPFSSGPNTRVYRTGDLGRLTLSGNIELIGRLDRQVKIRGNRIELEEIESCIRLYRHVSRAVVRCRSENGTTILDSYVVPTDSDAFSLDELRLFLSQKLPQVMMPHSYTVLDAIPWTVNGKIDYARLPYPEPQHAILYVAPCNETEKKLLEVWREVLKTDTIGMQDHFFTSGGNSLLALVLLSKINQVFHREDTIRVLFEHPTCTEYARYIEKEEIPAGQYHHLVRIQKGKETSPLFFVPGGWGEENEMAVFAGLLPYSGMDNAVYGFRTTITQENYRSIDSASQIIENYVQELVACYPQGKLRIAGECFGGLIALGIAHKLHAMGRELLPTILLDTRYPTPEVREKIKLEGLDILTGQHGAKMADRVFKYYQAVYGYEVQTCQVPVILLASRGTSETYGDDLGWRESLNHLLTIHRVPGDHDSYIREHRAELGRIFGTVCRESIW